MTDRIAQLAQLRSWRNPNTETQQTHNNAPTGLPSIPESPPAASPPPSHSPTHPPSHDPLNTNGDNDNTTDNTDITISPTTESPPTELAHPLPLLVQILINSSTPPTSFSTVLIPLFYTNTIASISSSIDALIGSNGFGIGDMMPTGERGVWRGVMVWSVCWVVGGDGGGGDRGGIGGVGGGGIGGGVGGERGGGREMYMRLNGDTDLQMALSLMRGRGWRDWLVVDLEIVPE